jgi:hypothetical protein
MLTKQLSNQLKVASCFIFFLMTNAHAEQWVKGIESDDGQNYYYDSQSITKDGDVVKYWELASYQKPLISKGIAIYSAKTYTWVNCKERTYKFIKSIYYEKQDGQGKVVYENPNMQPVWRHVSKDDAVDGGMQNLVCSYKF